MTSHTRLYQCFQRVLQLLYPAQQHECMHACHVLPFPPLLLLFDARTEGLHSEPVPIIVTVSIEFALRRTCVL